MSLSDHPSRPLRSRLASRASALRRPVLRKLETLRGGLLELRDAFGQHSFGESCPSRAEIPQARLEVHHQSFYSKVAFGGTIGAAEAYMDGLWTVDDLTALVRLLVRNRDAMERLEGGWGRLMAPLHRAYHAWRSNTRRGSSKNIREHYDLGNEFFALFLDDTMTYSCALFEPPEISLADASRAKIDRLCRKLDLGPDDHLLEIGTGWGALAVHAAATYGCRVTTTTLSPAQATKARQRIAAAGLADRITVLETDYRDLEGRYDKLVSVEMIEAVGHEFFDTFFAKCSALLAPDGLMALQAITIADRFYEQAKRSVDFIQRYIFPGGAIPSVTAMTRSVAAVTDLTPVHLEDISPHYARTLQSWRERFFGRLEEVRALGFSERFIRMWEFYFCYCEGGYRERSIGNVQWILAKPDNRRPPILGSLSG
ncbi:MAG: cyclopropane-fatty-acyl-phospholipid synthase family protein [Acidobacteriota bacterium]